MSTLHAHKVGVALGGLLAAAHLVWSVLVALGLGQAWVDWVFRMHFMTPLLVVGPFAPLTALGLIIMAGIMGYIMGFVFANIWNVVAAD